MLVYVIVLKECLSPTPDKGRGSACFMPVYSLLGSQHLTEHLADLGLIKVSGREGGNPLS